MLGFGKKGPASLEKYPDVREVYNPAYFNGLGLEENPTHELSWLRNLLVQGEVRRLETQDGFAAMLGEIKAMHETQKEILEELRMQRLGTVPRKAA